ncbi:MAG: HAD family hydrolase [Chloroflexota bacterium]
MPTTLLFFDLDATLVENQFSRQAIVPLLQEIAEASDLTIEQLGRAMGDENWRRQQETPNDKLTMDWQDIVDFLANKHGVTLSERVDERWQAVASADGVDVLDNAPDVLHALKAPHRNIILSTKGLRKYQMPVLEVTGLKAHFDDILTPDITGYLKTKPAYFAKYNDTDALKIQIGDHYYDDIICAREKGYQCILRAPIDALREIDPFERPQQLVHHREQIKTYPRTGTEIVPDAVVVSLEELPPIIEKMEAQSTG